ncbi:MAG: flippase-like domain-containing protein [bacterium]|jgi:uncharacterized protein (TIRG00374 family)|nr:flippase-like domain-containing protein [candidate division KSB1 bacterium]MDH7558913.1 flippase-like domain-containing protein [bacterium]
MGLPRYLRRLFLSLALSIAAIVLIFVFTGSRKTIVALTQIRPSYIGLLLMLGLAGIALDGARIMFLVRAADGKIGFWQGCKLGVLGVFGNVVTPFSTGGHVAIVYLLRQQRLPSGRGASVVLTRLLATGFFVLSGALLSLLSFGHLVTEEPAIRRVMLATAIVFLGLSALAVAALLNPRVSAGLGGVSGKVLSRIGVLRRQRRFQQRVNRHVLHARNSFRRFFSAHAVLLGWVLLCSAFVYVTQVLLLWAVLRALSLPTSLLQGLALSALLIFLLSFLPTPGGSGLGEALFVLVYSAAVPTHLLGVAVVLWRLFYQYLPAAMGAGVAASHSDALLSREGNVRSG